MEVSLGGFNGDLVKGKWSRPSVTDTGAVRDAYESLLEFRLNCGLILAAVTFPAIFH